MSPHRRPVPLWYALLAILVSTLAVAGTGIWYTHHAQEEADHRWCELLTVLSDRSPPPETDRGRRIAQEIGELRSSLGCPP
ncbi:hypothetical protein GA0074692_6856 [Micromonospora pallida]|uniref:Uncharacterized protein n=1 Tax=Micromonospora pallida TaxID=145854 RepID=A0A1C6TP73_9ACTN|nr:hypothetical protein [Micromonospora pallida]SCL43387.1 hypothetical protein GA0074692_6856 [Micromonospora pallida]